MIYFCVEFKSADTNGDGVLDQKEFDAFIKKLFLRKDLINVFKA
jgi:hypothetical protein